MLRGLWHLAVVAAIGFAACSLAAFNFAAFSFGSVGFGFGLGVGARFGFAVGFGFRFGIGLRLSLCVGRGLGGSVGFGFGLGVVAFSFAAFSLATFSFVTFSFVPDSLLACSLAVSFERLPAIGAAVRGLALFGSRVLLVAAGRRPVTRAAVFYPAVAWISVIAVFVRMRSSSAIRAAVIVVVRAIGPAMVPLGVSVAAAFRLVLGVAAFLAAALPDMLFAIAAGHGAVAVVFLHREHGRRGASRGGEHADKRDHAERGEKAARSIVRGGGSVPRAISFQFTHPAKREDTNRA